MDIVIDIIGGIGMSIEENKELMKKKYNEALYGVDQFQTGYRALDGIIQTGKSIVDRWAYKEAKKYAAETELSISENPMSTMRMELQYDVDRVNIVDMGDTPESREIAANLNVFLKGVSNKEFKRQYNMKENSDMVDAAEREQVDVRIAPTEHHYALSETYDVLGLHSKPKYEGIVSKKMDVIDRFRKRPYTPEFMRHTKMVFDESLYKSHLNPLQVKEGDITSIAGFSTQDSNKIDLKTNRFEVEFNSMVHDIDSGKATYEGSVLRVYGPPLTFKYNKSDYLNRVKDDPEGRISADEQYSLSEYEFTGDNLKNLVKQIEINVEYELANENNNRTNGYVNMRDITKGVIDDIVKVNNRVFKADQSIATNKITSLEEIEALDSNFKPRPVLLKDFKTMGLEKKSSKETIGETLEEEIIAFENTESYYKLEEQRALDKEAFISKPKLPQYYDHEDDLEF